MALNRSVYQTSSWKIKSSLIIFAQNLFITQAFFESMGKHGQGRHSRMYSQGLPGDYRVQQSITDSIDGNLPDYDGFPRVVQVEVGGRHYIRFGEDDFQSHPQILQKFLVENGISYETDFLPRTQIDVPKISGEGYKVTGMGFCRIYLDEQSATFSASSSLYGGLSLDNLLAERFAKQIPGWDVVIR